MFEKQEILPSTNPKSPFYNNLPDNDARPIDELVTYFKNYKHLIRNLINYLKEISLTKEFESNLHNQLVNSYNSNINHLEAQKRPNLYKSKSNSFQILGNLKEASLFDSTNALILNHHFHLYQLNSKHYKELVNKLIPKLENLHKNLSNKIKEIKSSLKNESFANDSIKREISKTGSILTKYISSIEFFNTKNTLDYGYDESSDNEDQMFDDPFLIKLRLNYQIKNQLIKENYLFASFVNLQNISKDLLAYILKDLAVVLEKVEKINHLSVKNLSFDVNSAWEKFIVSNNSFLNIYKSVDGNDKKEIRHFKNLVLPYSESVHNKCIRFGIIYKKLKLLKNYNRFYYLLTCNFLHEFKIENTGTTQNSEKSAMEKNTLGNIERTTTGTNSPKNKLAVFINHNDIPEKSYNLNNYQIVIKNDKNFKFNLVKISDGKQYSFKCNNQIDFNNWVNDLSDLLKYEDNFRKRYEFVEKKLSHRKMYEHAKLNDSRNSLHSVSSNAMLANLNSSSTSLLPLNSSASLNLTTPQSVTTTPSNIQLPASLGIGGQSLQGVFTPHIRTPSSSGSDKNPFDQSFSVDVSGSSGSSPGAIPPPQQTTNNAANVSTLGDLNHENYLKLQQEYLKSQQEIINRKLKQTELAKDEISSKNFQQPSPANDGTTSGFPPQIQLNQVSDKHSPIQSPGSTSYDQRQFTSVPGSTNQNTNGGYLGVHKHSSSVGSITSNTSMDSMKSLNPSHINNFLKDNKDLIVPKFFINDEDQETEDN